MKPTTLYPVISLFSLITVEYGGWALLGYLTGRGKLEGFRRDFFRAGHAHAGVMLMLSLVYFVYLDRTAFSTGQQRLAASLLMVGIACQSGGFFLHLALGQAGKSSAGTLVTRLGALLIGAALAMLAVGLILSSP